MGWHTRNDPEQGRRKGSEEGKKKRKRGGETVEPMALFPPYGKRPRQAHPLGWDLLFYPSRGLLRLLLEPPLAWRPGTGHRRCKLLLQPLLLPLLVSASAPLIPARAGCTRCGKLLQPLLPPLLASASAFLILASAGCTQRGDLLQPPQLPELLLPCSQGQLLSSPGSISCWSHLAPVVDERGWWTTWVSLLDMLPHPSSILQVVRFSPFCSSWGFSAGGVSRSPILMSLGQSFISLVKKKLNFYLAAASRALKYLHVIFS